MYKKDIQAIKDGIERRENKLSRGNDGYIARKAVEELLEILEKDAKTKRKRGRPKKKKSKNTKS